MMSSIAKTLPFAILLATTLGFTLHLRDADAWRGGYGGGSFRVGGYAERPRVAEPYVEPRRGEAVEGPRGNVSVEGPRGGAAVEGPRGNVAATGPRGNVVVGDRVTVLPGGANRVVVSGQTYYLAGGVYYMPFYYGGDITYVVVEDPTDGDE